MLKITEIASYLEIEISTVYNYISKGHLIGKKNEDGIYYINVKDFHSFIDNYWDKRHVRKGTALPKAVDFFTLQKYLMDIECDTISWEDFHKKYKYIKLLTPPIESFLLLKRNMCIANDYATRMKREDIAKKYELSKRSIDEILRKREDFSIAR